MSISVKYFASLRERMGRDGDQLQAAEVADVAAVWATVADNEAMPANMLCAVNMQYVDRDHPVNEGDEVAFFPPVTGG
ncbi:MAG: molybdopterin converting factor subunit 1 [Gammaproteobacteria bacterium]|nr:MAG: molybdopterin converting factor subunit 1 [Gammaproteobacteria bacterium]